MKMNKSLVSKSVSDNLIDLYTRIPDYSEVQHLGQSDFINTLESLKEEFRQCRASLYNEEFCSDSEYVAEKASPGNSRSRTTDNLYYYSSSKFVNTERENKVTTGGHALAFGEDGKFTKINNHNVTAPSSSAVAALSDKLEDGNPAKDGGGEREQYLSIKSCELHRVPYRSSSATSVRQTQSRNLINYGRLPISGRDGNFQDSGKTDSAFHDDYDDDENDDEDYDARFGLRMGRGNERDWSVHSSHSDVSISKWSSSPEIYRSRSRSKEHLPPSNVQKRLLQRKSQNNSAPSLAYKTDQCEDVPKPTFKANPVPEHVYKPLYEFIMLKNQRRSERIREQSKRRLLSQMKPFSFCRESRKCSKQGHKGENHNPEGLNNTKPMKKRRNDPLWNIKTNNNRLNSSVSALFRAKPAPPRTKALLAAIRQKEQQEYRELKKRLRAEMLLKNASLPPSMAAREKRCKLTNAKIDQVLMDYQKSFADKKSKNRNYRATSTGTDDTGLLTDEDRMTEDADDFLNGTMSTKKITTVVKPFKLSQRTPRKNFTSFGTSRHSAATTGVFEASSNDNHASRLRYQAAKLKEEERIHREEEEMLRIMRAERRRQKLRDCHLFAWQHACSYSAEQDIAMRRQLRHAASILERETFVRDMSSMLSRVRSAPLLLEGGNRLERKQEPCKKHREEFKKLFDAGGTEGRHWNKLSTPRLYGGSDLGSKHRRHYGGSSVLFSTVDRYGGGGEEKSETAAMAEGSLSNSDNESDDQQHHSDSNGRSRRRNEFLVTDSGSSDLENDENEDGVREQKIKENSAKQAIPVDNGQPDNHRTDNDRNAREDDALNTDNEINDEAGDEDEEEGQENGQNTSGNKD